MSRAKTSSKPHAQGIKRPNRAISPGAGSPGAGPVLTGSKLNAVLSAVLAAVTVLLYRPVLGHRFVIWDDEEYVIRNFHLRGGWSTIRWAFTSTSYASNWHPLTWLSHALDCQLFGLNPAGHHFESVLLHAASAVLLFLLLAWMTRRTGPSLLVAALFAVHPLNVESVAWLAERKNVLSTLFFLLAIGAYVRYTQKPDWRRYLVVAALFAAGLMAKPMVITLPFVLLLLDYWPLGRMQAGKTGESISDGGPPAGFTRLLLEKVPLLVFSAASAWITVVAQRSGFSVRNVEQFSFSVRAENAVVAYAMYLWKMLWPSRLAALYPHPGNSLAMWQVVLSAAILLAITALVWVFRGRRYLAVGWFWFLGTLVPVIGLVQVGEQAMADRYAYVPLIGIFVMVAFGLDDWAETKNISMTWRAVASACVLIVLCMVTVRQLSVWDSEYSLWTHTAEVTEQNPYAHAVLAAALMNPDEGMSTHDMEGLDTETKRLDEARRQYEEAVEIYRKLAPRSPDTYLPNMATTLGNLGNLARRQNRLEEARQHYEEALQYYRQLEQKDPAPHMVNIATTLNNVAEADRLLGRFDEAHEYYEEALQDYRKLAEKSPNPHRLNVATTLNNLALVDRRRNRLEEASQHYQEALQIDRQLAPEFPDVCQPAIVDALVNLGLLERAQNRPEKAYPYFEEALQVGRELAQRDPNKYLPNLAGRLVNLAIFDTELRRMDEARQRDEEALKIYRQLAQQNPAAYLEDVAVVLNSLGKMDGSQNRNDDARQCFEEALKIYRQLAQQSPKYLPDLAITLNNLALLDRIQKRLEESRAHYQEALNLFTRLSQSDNRYAGDAARVEDSLRELDGKGQAHP
jgi:tetratricopeptide (TPR) repeat protein